MYFYRGRSRQNLGVFRGPFTKLHFLKTAPLQNYSSKKRLIHKIPMCKICLFTKFKHTKTLLFMKKCYFKRVTYQTIVCTEFTKNY